ncbi:MAG: UDP-N-acetylmuramate--L-alanine ligase [Solirubrobacteraceae bacterium]
MKRPWDGRELHFVGVGGAGMSAYARAAHALGARVSGSDQADSAFARALSEDGVLETRIGHAAANVPPGADVVLSAAVGAQNPERGVALERGRLVLSRAQILGELTALRRTIAVAGAHGKTTTSSMIVSALRGGGIEPSYLIGGTPRPGERNAAWSDGPWLVVEADESDRSMLSLEVEIAVLTSVELDHHSEFGSLLELERVYAQFLARAPQAVICDRSELLALRSASAATVPYAREPDLRLAVPGEHNQLNAAAALAVSRLVGAEIDGARIALERFEGAGRRFELLGRTAAGAAVYNDYAHHPTEIGATLAAARELGPDRLIAVFQPHLYSRTRELAREFGLALAAADLVAVLDVYPARERAADHPGVSGLTIAAAAADAAAGREVLWLPSFALARRVLEPLLRSGDVVVAMGAGHIDAFGWSLVR